MHACVRVGTAHDTAIKRFYAEKSKPIVFFLLTSLNKFALVFARVKLEQVKTCAKCNRYLDHPKTENDTADFACNAARARR